MVIYSITKETQMKKGFRTIVYFLNLENYKIHFVFLFLNENRFYCIFFKNLLFSSNKSDTSKSLEFLFKLKTESKFIIFIKSTKQIK